jgi:hypothetical protein
MFSWSDVLVHQERCSELRRQADEYRLIRLALAGRRRRRCFHCRAMNWLGRRLVVWGWHLQTRYGTAVPQAVHCTR